MILIPGRASRRHHDLETPKPPSCASAMIDGSMPHATTESRSRERQAMPDADEMSAVEQPAGLFLNALRVRCCWVHRLTRLPRPDSRGARRHVQRDLGVTVRDGGAFAYVAGEIEIDGGSHVQLACDVNRDLHLFDLRESVAAHARERGLDVRFGLGGGLRSSGFSNAVSHDPYRV